MAADEAAEAGERGELRLGRRDLEAFLRARAPWRRPGHGDRVGDVARAAAHSASRRPQPVSSHDARNAEGPFVQDASRRPAPRSGARGPGGRRTSSAWRGSSPRSGAARGDRSGSRRAWRARASRPPRLPAPRLPRTAGPRDSVILHEWKSEFGMRHRARHSGGSAMSGPRSAGASLPRGSPGSARAVHGMPSASASRDQPQRVRILARRIDALSPRRGDRLGERRHGGKFVRIPGARSIVRGRVLGFEGRRLGTGRLGIGKTRRRSSNTQSPSPHVPVRCCPGGTTAPVRANRTTGSG